MESISYKNRIAFYYIVSTGLLISFVFLIIYQIITYSVYNHINDYIDEEVAEHLDEIKIDKSNTYLIQVNQWREIEKNTVNVNSVFVQFLDINDELIDKSPNLKKTQLKLYPYSYDNKYIDEYLNGKPIRQIQVPILDNKKIVGRLFIAVSLDEATIILANLRNINFISFPIIMILLFLIARFIVGRSIKPITSITKTASKITKDNLKSRMDLPQNKDELYTLSKTINDLLERIENAVEREKQFTSDASHELRTPLAVIKGTLEVLVRKPRNQVEYEEKINFCVKEVDRLNNLVDQLLLLARFENQNKKSEPVFLNALILDVLSRYSNKIKDKKIIVKYVFEKEYYITSDDYLLSIIISNLISNALKYSTENGKIILQLTQEVNQVVFKVIDEGIGINQADIDKIFSPFYRSQAINHPEIKGIGLGLSIVKRLCELLKIDIKIQPNVEKGVTFTLFLT